MNTVIIICLLASFTLGLAAMLVLCFGLRRDLHAHIRQQRVRIGELETKLQREAPEKQAGEHASPAPPPGPHFSAVNISRRIQAARLLRRGEDIANIAKVLGMPRREAELLVRIHQIRATAEETSLAS